MDTPNFEVMSIERIILSEVRTILSIGGFIVGGYPLYVCKGANTFSDIDVYAPNSESRTVLERYFRRKAQKLEKTQHAQQYQMFESKRRFDLVDEGFKTFDWREVLIMADLSPSAVCITTKDYSPIVYALYPDNIRNRVCRVLDEHDFTDYRIRSYQVKGYTIIR